MSLFPSRRSLAWNGPLITLTALAMAGLAGVLLMQLSPLQGMICVGLVAVVIGTLIEPFVGLATALFLGPLRAYLGAEVPQVPAQIGHVFIVLALGSWLARRLAQRDVRVTESPVLLPLFAFLGAVLLSLWDATGAVAFGVPELVKWVQIGLLGIFVSQHLLGEGGLNVGPGEASLRARRLRWLVVVVLSVGLFQAGVGIWQFAFRGEGPEHFAILGGAFSRAYGTFEQPNPYGGYLGLTAALALGLAADGIRSHVANGHVTEPEGGGAAQPGLGAGACQPIGLPLSVFAGGAGLVMLAALGASWSRGAWMGFGMALLAMAVSLPRRVAWGLLLGTLLVIVGLGLYTSGQLPPSLTARLTSFVRDIRLEDVRGMPISEANYAVIERLAHWQAALSMFRHNLWVGIGFGCYEAAYSTFALINWPIALGHAHNYYLNLAAETGLIGLLTYGSLWIVIFWQTWRVTRRGRGLTRGLAVGLFGTWVHISVHHLLDSLYVNNAHLLIGVLCGILMLGIQQTRGTMSRYDR